MMTKWATGWLGVSKVEEEKKSIPTGRSLADLGNLNFRLLDILVHEFSRRGSWNFEMTLNNEGVIRTIAQTDCCKNKNRYEQS